MKRLRPIVILGSGGMAREVAWLIEAINAAEPQWEILGFSEFDPDRIGEQVGKYPICYTDEQLETEDVAIAIGIGNPDHLERLYERFGNRSADLLPNLIHPSVIMDPNRVTLGLGNIVCAGTVFTVDVRVGSFCIVNINCTVSHDVIIGDCCVVNPCASISGGVELAQRCLVGAGGRILQYLHVGEGVTVGAGAVVTKDISPHMTVVGIPARPMNRG